MATGFNSHIFFDALRYASDIALQITTAQCLKKISVESLGLSLKMNYIESM